MTAKPELQPLRAGHAPAILAFEVANRSYFAASIADRGDDFFRHFDDRHEDQLAEQATGRCAYFVLVEADGSVVGRFNLYEIGGGTAELGYRVAQRVAGRGVATAAVEQMCRVAASELRLSTLEARTTCDNVGSRRVLTKAGFVPCGSTDIGGRPACRFRRDLSGGTT
jgi:ribosomal-protein-alanine N-acetyltransferase